MNMIIVESYNLYKTSSDVAVVKVWFAHEHNSSVIAKLSQNEVWYMYWFDLTYKSFTNK